MLTRDRMISHPPLLKTKTVDVPEFGEGEKLALRALTARQRWAFGKMASKSAESKDESGFGDTEPTSYLITVSAIDDNGVLIFKPQDVDVIADWPGDLVDRIGTVIMEMSGLSKPTDEAVAEAGEGSPETPNSGTDSSSLESSAAPSES